MITFDWHVVNAFFDMDGVFCNSKKEKKIGVKVNNEVD